MKSYRGDLWVLWWTGRSRGHPWACLVGKLTVNCWMNGWICKWDGDEVRWTECPHVTHVKFINSPHGPHGDQNELHLGGCYQLIRFRLFQFNSWSAKFEWNQRSAVNGTTYFFSFRFSSSFNLLFWVKLGKSLSTSGLYRHYWSMFFFYL